MPQNSSWPQQPDSPVAAAQPPAGFAVTLAKAKRAKAMAERDNRFRLTAVRAPKTSVEVQSLVAFLREAVKQEIRQPFRRWVLASTGSTVRMLCVEDILFFQSDTKYTRAVGTGTELFLRLPLQRLIQELDPDVFWPIHRSAIVNVHAIDAVVRDASGRVNVQLKNRQEVLPVSSAHAYRFRPT